MARAVQSVPLGTVSDESAYAAGAERRCYRHPDRRGGVLCQRCDRIICPQCMQQASVGFQCPECVHSASRAVVSELRPGALLALGVGAESFWATKTLLALNLAGFVYSLATGGTLLSLRGSTAMRDGALFGKLSATSTGPVIGVDAGEYYRLITSAFLHDGMIHLAFNLYVLWFLGQLLERAFGWPVFASVYAVSLFGGAFGVMLTAPNAPTVGASGALFGMMGTMAALQKVTGISFWRSSLGVLLIVNLAFTMLIPGLSKGGHLGGLFAGLAMGWMIRTIVVRGAPRWTMLWSAAGLSVCMVVGSIWAASHWREPVLAAIFGSVF